MKNKFHVYSMVVILFFMHTISTESRALNKKHGKYHSDGSQTVQSERYQNSNENKVPLVRKKFRVWKPLRTVGDKQILQPQNKSVEVSEALARQGERKRKTKALVKSQVKLAPQHTPEKSFLDRCYLRAKLKLDYEKVSTQNYSIEDQSSSYNPSLLHNSRNYHKVDSKSLIRKQPNTIPSLFQNSQDQMVPKYNISVTQKQRNNVLSLFQTSAYSSVKNTNVKEEYLSYSNLAAMCILLSALVLLLCWGCHRQGRARGLQDEMKTELRPECESSDSYGSITSDDETRSARTVLNLTRNKVDLSNITLCNKCDLYQFK